MAAEDQSPSGDPRRISTGTPGLDVLLSGGLMRGAIYLLMGRPGTGKTTLGNQMCFAHVRGGERAGYVTLLAESQARMLGNLQSMAFFDQAPIGSSLLYMGGYLALRQKRLPGLLEVLRRLIRDERISLLVLDGMSSAQTMAESPIALKEFLVELQVLCTVSDCTALLLGNLDAADTNGPEHSMVDGLLELTLHRSLQRTLREIEVIKFRGSEHMLGRHDLEISSQGVVVRPRTEELAVRYLPPPGRSAALLSTGIAGLDEMLGGGLLSGSTSMLLGFSGSGKTNVGVHFLDAGAKAGEAGIYFGFYESPERLIQGAQGIGLDLAAHVASGKLDLVWQPPMRHGLDGLADRLLDNVRARGVKRVVIDGLDGIRQTSPYHERTIRFVTALVNILRAMDVTTIFTEETQKLFGPDVEVRVEGMSALVDNILLLEYLDDGTDLRRLLSIVKQRGRGYDPSVRQLCITSRGIELLPKVADVDASPPRPSLRGIRFMPPRGSRGD
jgi:circadian clock protein KaiC